MESHEKRDSDDAVSAPDTSHLKTQGVTKRSFGTAKFVWFIVLIAVIAVIAAGFYLYKTNVMDKQGTETGQKNSPSPSPTPTVLSPEEQMTAALNKGIKRELAELKGKDDATVSAIINSTQAAVSVGSNLNEDTLKQYQEN